MAAEVAGNIAETVKVVVNAAAEKVTAMKTNTADTIFNDSRTKLTIMNTFGKFFTLTTFGESHGAAIGGVVDGMPAGIDIDLDFIQSELNRRRPGQSKLTTSRQ